MIFISHTSADKVIVEQIALRLAEVFGKERIFMTVGPYSLVME